MLCFDRKKEVSQGEKHIAPMDFAEYPRKSDFLENSKVYYGRLKRNEFYGTYCYIS